MKFFVPLPVRVPFFVKWWYPKWYVWDRVKKDKVLYLTFDDGPIPKVTDWVLDTLSQKQNKDKSPVLATFFCIGDNVQKHPEVFNKILAANHTVGNHTYNHLKGWETLKDSYIENTILCEQEMSRVAVKDEKSLNFPLFRPPYGKIKRRQAKALKKKGFEIIMYRTVAYDWDENITAEQCLENVIKRTKNGDLIVFHDSAKAFKNMKYALPKVIDYFLEKGYRFEKL